MQVPQPPELFHLITPLILLPPPNAEILNEVSKVENADESQAIFSVHFNPDGKTIVSGGAGTIKVWDAGTLARHTPHPAQS